MDIFCASAAARAGIIIKSSCYFGRNEAVKYRNIKMYAIRGDDPPGGIKLGMLIQLLPLKGRRNHGGPSILHLNELNL